MIIEYIRYTISESDRESFMESYGDASRHLLASEFCLSYDMCQCVEDPSQFTVRIHWTSAEDHLQRFRGSAEFKRFFVLIKKYVNDIDEMRHYTLLDTRDSA